MAKFSKNSESGEDSVGIGTQAWNVSEGYMKVKILRLLIQVDLNEEIAMFGKKDDMDNIPTEKIPEKRVEGMDKMIFHLRQLIGNCKFSIEKGYDEKLMAVLFERLVMVEENVSASAKWITNQITNEDTLEINEKHFRKCFDILRSIKDELNFILNRAGLIFRTSDTLDLDEIMRSVEDGY